MNHEHRDPGDPAVYSSSTLDDSSSSLRWGIGLTAVIGILLATAWGVARVVDLEQYRVWAEREIADRTGLSIQIEELDIRLLPTPAVRAMGVTIGDASFGGTASLITVHPSFERLLEGVVELERIEVYGAAVTLAPEATVLQARIGSVTESLEARRAAPDAPPARLRVNIDTITLHDATLTMQGDAEPLLTGRVRIANPTSDAIGVEVTAEALRFGARAVLAGEGTVHRVEGGIDRVDATVAATGIDLAAITEDPDARELEMALRLTATDATLPKVAFGVDGALAAKPDAKGAVGTLAGPIRGNGWWSEGTLILNDLTLEAPGVHAVGDVTRHPDGLFAVLLERVDLRPAAFPLLAARVPMDTASITPGSNATASASDVYFAFGGANDLTVDSLHAAFDGWRVETPRGPIEHLRGAVRWDVDRIVIDELVAEGVTVTGTVRPDPGGTELDLQARAALTPALLAMAGAPPALAQAEGNLALTRITGTVRAGEALPADLAVTGTLEGGAFRIESGAIEEVLSGVSAAFEATGDSIAIEARGTSARTGTLRIHGVYTPSVSGWEGQAELDVVAAARGWSTAPLPEEAWPLLNAFGQSVFDVRVAMPGGASADGGVSFTRHGSPPLGGSIAFVARGQETVPGPIAITTQLTAAHLAGWMPAGSTLEGGVPIAFASDPGTERFRITAEASDAALTIPPYFRKDAGEQLGVAVEGSAAPGDWGAHAAVVTLGGEVIALEPRGERWVVPDLDLALERLAPFLTLPAAVSGRVAGTLLTNPVEADLAVHGVAIAPDPDTVLQAESGRIRYGPAGIAVDALRLRGAGSDCTLTGGFHEGVWRGDLTGARLDLNALTAVADAFRGVAGGNEVGTGTAAPGSDASQPQASARVDGTVALDEVVYRRAVLSGFSARLAMRDGILRIEDIETRPGQGVMRGSIEYAFATPAMPARVGLDLAFDEVNTALLDALSTEPARGLHGTANARIRIATALPPDRSPLHAMSGEIVFSAVHGSWGRMGMATRVLSVLRTVEIVRLRLPSGQDEGLVYDTSEGRILFDEGLMTLESFEMRNATFQARATGAADWPRDVCEYRIQVLPLEVVTGVVSAVPIVGNVAQGVSEGGAIRLIADGPATQPQVRLEPGQSINRLRDQIVDSTRSVDERLREGVVDAAGSLIRGLLGN